MKLLAILLLVTLLGFAVEAWRPVKRSTDIEAGFAEPDGLFESSFMGNGRKKRETFRTRRWGDLPIPASYKGKRPSRDVEAAIAESNAVLTSETIRTKRWPSEAQDGRKKRAAPVKGRPAGSARWDGTK
ncbi:hypothetical protein PMAYCL1PPCAC_22360 [Pristionchus mayeri]|uniref:Uncharacterized protein n=1 Tax=Pristionchus mayeri TaxID=1317129 RepID=A0AAN5CXM8_9BILA|nr:hypothetical protein PMAYCL1PPCAC_22360 [Pristionchus mayeri]